MKLLSNFTGLKNENKKHTYNYKMKSLSNFTGQDWYACIVVVVKRKYSRGVVACDLKIQQPRKQKENKQSTRLCCTPPRGFQLLNVDF